VTAKGDRAGAAGDGGRAEGETDPREQRDDLVRFFEALPAAARREYEALAAIDRKHGEDVFAEERADQARRRS
jgi:hypothetical protein